MTEYFTKEEVQELLFQQRKICQTICEKYFTTIKMIVAPEPELKGKTLKELKKIELDNNPDKKFKKEFFQNEDEF